MSKNVSQKEKILISACLIGEPVRYDGKSSLIDNEIIKKWQLEERLVAVCPEVASGMSVPRLPCERDQFKGQVITECGRDQTHAFQKGAETARSLAVHDDIKLALLKERSPSCGVREIYDGSFSARKIAGQGITTQVLQEAGVRCFSENEISELLGKLEEYEAEAET